MSIVISFNEKGREQLLAAFLALNDGNLVRRIIGNYWRRSYS